jgi:hypothetical protein
MEYEDGELRFHPGVVQYAASALGDRVAFTCRVGKAAPEERIMLK